MSDLKIIILAATGLVLFLYGIDHFSKEMQSLAGDNLKRIVQKLTRNRVSGFCVGAFATAMTQSSTAVTVITLTLVGSGVLTFKGALGVIIGSNVGTTITAQLVALKLTELAPVIILTGALISILPFRWKIIGRLIFYFGFLFFGLDLVGDVLAPLGQDPRILKFISETTNPYTAILVGIVVTAIVQSSSVVTGLCVVLVQSGVLPLSLAVPLVMGSNAGTTVTTIIASVGRDQNTKRTALAHLIFNVMGVVVFAPWVVSYTDFLRGLSSDSAQTLAWGHIIFNLAIGLVFLILLRPYAYLLEKLVPASKPLRPEL